MQIEYDNIHRFSAGALESIAMASLPAHSEACPHCGLQVLRPTVARKSDLDAFADMMAVAQRVLARNGVSLLLLSEVCKEIAIANAKKAKEEKR